MYKRVAVSLVGAMAVLTTVVSASQGAREAASAGTPKLLSVHALTPPRGGASRAPHGWLPLHAAEFARAKAAANSRAGLHANAATSAAQGGATVTSYPNVSPSFDGDYETGLTPPDTTGTIGAALTRASPPSRSPFVSSFSSRSRGCRSREHPADFLS